MASVDDRIVSMSFQNSRFESGVARSLSSLNKLKDSLKFSGAGKGLDQLQSSASKFNLSGMNEQLDNSAHRWSIMRIAAITAIATITRRVVDAGLHIAAAFTVDPIKEGFQNYETQIQAVQTIMANTGLKGSKGLGKVNKVLAQLNTYANKTVYNFSEMAKNIGTFTAAGVNLKTSEESIKGIANLAALSGSSSQQASMAMYQLSQAIAAGRVQLQDWNSVTNAGIGGKVFQKALINAAEAMGTLKSSAVKTVGPMHSLQVNGEAFRQSLSTQANGGKSWLTSGVLTTALSNFTGDMSKAKLASEGFNKAQIKTIQSQAKVAVDAATKVKSLTQLTQSLKEEVGTAYAAIFKTLIGNISQAKALFSPLHQTLENALTGPIYAVNKVLAGWAKAGGRTAAIDAIKTAFQNLGKVLAPIKSAFREIFPPASGAALAAITKKVDDFLKSVKIAPDVIDGLKRTFAGLFAAVDIGRQILGGIISVIGKLIGTVAKGSGGFLQITGSIGDWIVAVDNALKKGNGLQNFFGAIAVVLEKPIEALQKLKSVIGHAFDSLNAQMKKLSNSGATFQKYLDNINAFIKTLGQDIAQGLSQINWSQGLNLVGIGIVGGLLLAIKKALGKGLTLDIGKMLFGTLTRSVDLITGKISENLEIFGGNLKAFQNSVNAGALLKLAAAIGIIAGSMALLSAIKGQALERSMTAVAVGVGYLLGAMKVLTIISTTMSVIKIPVMAASLILLATAVGALSLSVMLLSRLNWNQLAKGLVGVSVLLAAMSAASIPLSRNSKGMIAAGAGITAMAVGMNIMALAVKQMGSLDWVTLAKGLGGVAAILIAVAAASRLFPKSMGTIGLQLILIAGAMKLMGSAISDLGSLDYRTLGVGLGAVAASLLIIAGAMKLMPPTSILQAGALAVLALALQQIAKAVKAFGSMSIATLAKGLISLGAALAILAVGLNAMDGALPGAAALIISAEGISILAKALATLGHQSWGSLIKEFVAMGAAIGILAAGGLLLAPVTPALLALGAAMVLVGGGFALLGGGIALMGTGLAAIAVAGPAALKIFLSAITGFAKAVPQIAKSIVDTLLAIAKEIAKDAPQLIKAMVTIIGDLAAGITKAAPKMIQAGIQLLLDLLKGISQNIGKVVTQVASIVTKFLNALASKASQIIKAGANLVIKLLDGISSNLGKVVTAAAKIITRFVEALGNNYTKIVTEGGKAIAKFVTGLGNAMGHIVNAAGTAIVRFVTALGNNADRVITAGANVMIKFISGFTRNAGRIVNAAARAIIAFLNALDQAVNLYSSQIVALGIKLGVDIVLGIIRGIASYAGHAISAAEGLARKVLSVIAAPFHIGSPSKTMIKLARFIVQGMAIGLNDRKEVIAAASKLSNGIIDNVKSIFEINSPSKVMEELGKYISQGLAKGLKGSASDIRQQFSDLQQVFSNAISSLKSEIDSTKQKLAEAQQSTHPDKKRIEEYEAQLAQYERDLGRVTAAHKEFTDSMDRSKKKLIDEGEKLTKVQNKLANALQTLHDKQDELNQAQQDYTSQFEQIDIPQNNDPTNPIDPLATYTQGLTTQAAAVSKYMSTLDQLRKLGLDDDTYKKLLADGTADQQFADELLSGGSKAIQGLNALDKRLDNAASALGKDGANSLYRAGVQSAQGIVDGLKSQEARIEKEMAAIAKKMVQAIKKKLKIKSPSKEFAAIGQFSAEGMAEGLSNSSKIVSDAAASIGSNAITAMQKSISSVSKTIFDGIDTNPVITPVMDLTKITKDAKTLGDLSNNPTIKAATSYSQAKRIDTTANADSVDEHKGIMFVQNNTSPVALSNVDIYRQTKNQLSQAKRLLAIV